MLDGPNSVCATSDVVERAAPRDVVPGGANLKVGLSYTRTRQETKKLYDARLPRASAKHQVAAINRLARASNVFEKAMSLPTNIPIQDCGPAHRPGRYREHPDIEPVTTRYLAAIHALGRILGACSRM
ncbi:hypothetical protein K503DRAFT_565092 [Rhizopogon vinicolor AM-OR11-026]|uniref:Uncharacterized protein n=1 Tax=Rhizopogon vinicolor AM-OR11-026 TaxID=1314800 RepID=A0A1B7N7T0_9AGAM|nr:hypothetical protein K503DRAFT_565092 [Rhizopogon vinicolor AM-OR11-026]